MGCYAIFEESISTASGTRCYYMLVVVCSPATNTDFPYNGVIPETSNEGLSCCVTYVHGKRTLGEEPLAKMSAAVENGVDASKPRGGVFSRAFAKRAQPYEEGEFDDSSLVTLGQVVVLHTRFPLHGAWEDKHRAIGFKPGVRHA
ncbi:hypothetical protein G5I_05646 [Acromyrmex echinatior]|uniref:Uncharacterized protein n=1 Tax=Acromyrmex echinatior TaxID=103372 RepID=F4WIX0_ACREC|nr:hypothetical protein G5I_05646 [Acromyrmex echinatior]